MQEFKLSYGTETISLHIPEQNVAGFYSPSELPTASGTRTEIERALQSVHPSFSTQINGKRICVFLEDGTRSEPHQEIIDVLVPKLNSAKSVTFFITTGSHDIKTEKNRQIIRWLEEKCKAIKLPDYRIVINDCFDTPAFVKLNVTFRGTPILVNKHILDAEVFVVVSDCKYHYFAGYGNYLKSLLPGACAFASIEKNHSLALDELSTFGRHPWHPDPARRIQPLAEDMLEAEQVIVGRSRITISLSMVTAKNRIAWIEMGESRKVSGHAIEFIDAHMSFMVNPVKYLVVSPGAKPEGDQLYDAQRGLELTKQALVPGGEILWLVPCDLGIAPNQQAKEHFYDLLASSSDPEEVMRQIAGGYKLYSHKAYKFAQMLKEAKISVYTELPEQTINAIHMQKITDPQLVINRWISTDPEARIIVVDGANKTVLHKGKG